MAGTDLTISIVSFNTREILRQCLGSIFRHVEGVEFEVIVVDNNSTDGSVEMIRRDFPSVILIRNDKNIGFGKAHNLAFKRSNGRYFLILNSDTYVYPETINQMVWFMDSHSEVGVGGFKTYVDKEKTIVGGDHVIPTIFNSVVLFTEIGKIFPDSSVCRRFWHKNYKFWLNSDNPKIVEGVDGSAIFIRRELFQALEGFDENFFLFFEESDLFRRVRKCGYLIALVPDLEIFHYVHGSQRANPDQSQKINTVFFQSMQHYYKKHYGWLGLIFCRLLLCSAKTLLKLYSKYFNIEQKENLFSKVIRPDEHNLIHVSWKKSEQASGYLLELAPSASFTHRGGMFTENQSVSLSSSLPGRFPGRMIYWRVMPLYRGSVGNILECGVIKA